MKVKICGVTNVEDANYIAQMGADAIGFVFYDKSPRYIDYKSCAKIIDTLPPFITTVGLFVNADKDEIDKGASISKIDVAQLHFDIDKEFIDSINFKNIPVIRARNSEDIEKFDNYKLVDVYCESYGGSGKRVNLEWFKGLDCSKTIIAGGLTPDNLAQLKGYGFYGVDVSSGVELEKGKKDYKKVKEFIEHAKAL